MWSSVIVGEHPGVWYIDMKNGAGGAGSGEPPVKADVEMSLDSDDFIKMFTGEEQLLTDELHINNKIIVSFFL